MKLDVDSGPKKTQDLIDLDLKCLSFYSSVIN